MNIKIHKTLLTISILLSLLAVFNISGLVIAEEEWVCTQSGLSLPECKEVSVGAANQPPLETNPIYAWVNFFINLVSATIIVGASLMIAVAGVQYASARDNAQAVQTAKQKIGTIFGALMFYFFLYAFMQWLIPGGLF